MELECVKLLERIKEMSKMLLLENIVCIDLIFYIISFLVEGYIVLDDLILG